MNICFITYWSIKEGLAQATVLPHLKILAEFEKVKSIQFISMERQGPIIELDLPKVVHHPVYSSESSRDKLTDNVKSRRLLNRLHDERTIDLVMARGVMAAWLSLKFVKQNQVPFSIESFEPHADYMVEDGVWNRFGLRYRVLSNAEKAEKKMANFLLPVTEAYRQKLIKTEGIDSAKILTMPCCVDVNRFQFNEGLRAIVRTKIGIHQNTIVGIYTGKIGGIYLKDEAISLIKLAQEHYGAERFYLIILSPDVQTWNEVLSQAGFEKNQYHIGFVDLSEVGAYLSAADFAFSLHRPSPSKIGISPIKNGEYFANGLPVIMPTGIGDDSEIVENEKLGTSIPDFSKMDRSVFEPIDALMKLDRNNSPIAVWAFKHRSFEIVRHNYGHILEAI